MRFDLRDDTRILREALSVALEERGHQVLAAATTATLGIAEVAAQQPDACLLDLHPAPTDDLSAARMAHKLYPGTAVPLFPGLADRALIEKATRIGWARIPGSRPVSGMTQTPTSGEDVLSSVFRTKSNRASSV
jgi:DNA-binding NarL/FixJ family response regulator